MKIQFDGNQNYQLDAINAVVNVFDGQPLASGEFELSAQVLNGADMPIETFGTSNDLALDGDQVLKNIRAVQKNNGITPSAQVEMLPSDSRLAYDEGFYNFSIEMETGTGKTYVYLRSIYELHKCYGLTKFIIVVPSIAIREGVMSSLQLMEEHFKSLYNNVPLDAWVYDSKRISKLRQYALSNSLQIMVMNIQAFDKKDMAVIHKYNDLMSGRKPVEFIQSTNPIVILDEPQNMESAKARQAIASLNPLCTLRYSATHKNPYNLLYKLDPVGAYDLNLVKRIEVDSVMDDPDFNQPYIHIKSVMSSGSSITAKIEMDVASKTAVKRKVVSITKSGTDLLEKSNRRDNYTDYIVDEINAEYGYVSFTNGLTLYVGQTHGGKTDKLMRVQIRETIKEHFEKELRIQKTLPEGKRLKVLSLFFIDRVSNYWPEDGKLRHWFVEAYEELACLPRYKELALPPVEKVHSGYFSTYKNTPKDTRGNTSADESTYELIMRDKERLLSLDEPLKFIFSHSALREGWDNPNVFQICTLNETKSEIKKRQEIGRGLRLPVLEDGNRCFDPMINRLTVIANEKYEEFARKLQTEIEDECGVSFEGRIKNKRTRVTANLVPGWKDNKDFKALWKRIKYRTRYTVKYDSKLLIENASRRLQDMAKIEAPAISIKKAALDMDSEGVSTRILAVKEDHEDSFQHSVPDLISFLQDKTELTRTTLVEILIGSGRLSEVQINPQQFLDQALTAIQSELHSQMIDGIKYERIEGETYEMRLFEEQEISGYETNSKEVDSSIYDVIFYDSEIERKFAETMSSREDIKMFIKLPSWFKVKTPIGSYNPDWAIVKEEDDKVYLVRETKGTTDLSKLRSSEKDKIKCGQAHFGHIGVDFGHISDPISV